MFETFKDHWPEYLIEAWCLATFMVSACFFGSALFYPGSPAAAVDAGIRNIFMGLAMGSTAVAIIRSKWGRRSGAHFNPAVTLTFLRLGKIAPADAAFYVLAQFVGGTAGVALSSLFLGNTLSDAAVNYVATVPGTYGHLAAFGAEAAISFLMMAMVLATTNSPRWNRATPYFAGLLVATFIAVENPLSGMSMNPARTFASALFAGVWDGWWIYFTAPLAAMLGAAEAFSRRRGRDAVRCAKLDHSGTVRCIFNCRAYRPRSIDVARHRDLFPTVSGLF